MFEYSDNVPLSGFDYRSSRDEVLADLADLLIDKGYLIETMERVDAGWKLTYKFNPAKLDEGERG